MSTLLLPSVGLLISVLTFIVYYNKRNDDERESKFYTKILICNVIYAIFGTLTFVYGLVFENVLVMEIIEKVHMIMTLGMIMLLSYYVLIGAKLASKVEKAWSVVMGVIGGCFSLLTLFSPVNVGEAGSLIYGNGFGYNVILTCIVGFLLVVVGFATHNLSKKYSISYISSFVVLALLYGFGLIFRVFFPEVIFENFVIAFVLLVMYLTIENPYLKRIDNLEEEKSTVVSSNEDKSEFLGNMSKEIRMPLNSIIGLTEDILGHRDELSQEVVDDVHDISRASQSLLEIVDDILEFNESDNPKSDIVEVTYNFNEAIGGYLRDFDMKNKKPNVTFTFNIADDIPYELIGDVNHIKEVVDKVLSNAYANTNAGNVDFTAKSLNEEEGCELILKIQDTSKNVVVDFSNEIYLVERMNGKMNVHKQEDGLLVLIHIPQKVSNISKFMKTSEMNNKTDDGDYGHRRILIVDDNVLNIKVTSKALMDFGFEIDSVESGEECIERIQAGFIYDLILMDIMMPDMGGEETFGKLKEIEGFRIPVMALTADAESGAKARYVSQGFIDYIAKPFSREQIKTRLDLIFGNNSAPEIVSEIPVEEVLETKDEEIETI